MNMSEYDEQDQAYVDLHEYAVGLERLRDSLLEAIEDIADIIHHQMPLRHQDKWLARMIEAGYVAYEEE